MNNGNLGPQARKAFQYLEQRLSAGEFAPNSRLPSQVRLARECGVALLTVRQALARLEAQGRVLSIQGSGTFALSGGNRDALTPAGRVDPDIPTDRLRTMAPNLERGIQETTRRWPDRLESSLHAGRQAHLAAEHIEASFEGRAERLSGIIALQGEILAATPDLRLAVQAEALAVLQAGETALRASERRFRTTFEQAGVGIAHTSLDGSWILINQRLLDMYGYTEAELRDLRFQDITHPDDLAADLEALDRLLSGECRSYQMEKRYVRRDGSLLWSQLTVALARTESDEPDYVIAVIEDISSRKQAERALVESEERFRTSFEHANVGMDVLTLDGHFLRANPAYCSMLGYTETELHGLRFSELTHPDDAGLDDQFSRLIAGEIDSYGTEKRVLHRDGRIVWVQVNASIARDASGRPSHIISQVQDITARAAAESTLRVHAAQQAALAHLSTQALHSNGLDLFLHVAVEVVKQTLAADQAAVLEMEHSSGDFIVRARANWPESGIGRTSFPGGRDTPAGYAFRAPAAVVSADLRAESRFAPSQALLESGLVSSMMIVVPGLEQNYGLLGVFSRTPRQFTADDVMFLQGVAGVLAAAVERDRMERRLEHQALHDPLSDLPNRTLLLDRVRHTILSARRDCSPLALLLLDLDRFKELNDTLGHHCGDLLLQQMAKRLLSAVRQSDTVARLGGDEFAILLPDTDEYTAGLVAGRIMQAMVAPFIIEQQTLYLGASVGIALYPDHGTDAGSLLRRADVAMYVAKRHNSSFEVYNAKQDQHTPDRMSLLSDLRVAIEQEQLVLVYQPKIDMRTGAVSSVEALVRWTHPDRGVIPPSDFIPLAEQTGLIEPLTRWVLGEATEQAARWRESGLDLGVAVNLSARSLHDPRLVDTVARVAADHAGMLLPLTLEVTESAIMVDPEVAMQIVTALHDMGLRMSIDDFGTGYSSLAYLKRLPVDEVKIDRSFVMDMETDRDSAFIVRTIVDLGHNLGLDVVAEGVETQHALDALAVMGCESAQGFHFSRPLAPDDLRVWIALQGTNTAVA